MATAIIPARAGSRGIKNKNRVSCLGKPLFMWSVLAAQAAVGIREIVVSSDDDELLDQCPLGVSLLRRPGALARDDTPTETVIAHAIDALGLDDDIFVLLQPTSPFREGRHIDEALSLLMEKEADSVVSVVRSHNFLWSHPDKDKGGRPRPDYEIRSRPQRQDMVQFTENGSLYVFSLEHWIRTANRLGGHVELYEMAPEYSFQIDEPFDLWLIEQVMSSFTLSPR